MGVSGIAGFDLDTSEFRLPIHSGFTINVNSGKIVLDQDIELHPGAEINVASGAECTLGNNVNVHLYDASDWGDYIFLNSPVTAGKIDPIAWAPSKIYTRTEADLVDAKFVIGGVVSATSGNAYTTPSGAAITGVEGAKIYLNPKEPTTSWQFVYRDADYQDDYVQINLVSAKLQHKNGEYLETAGAEVSEKPYVYSHDFWHTPTCGAVYTGEITEEATCQTNGTMTYTCGCNHSYTEVIEKSEEHHKPNVEASTCTVAKVCTVAGCGATLEEMKPHTKSVTQNQVNADCSKGTNGCKAYYLCNVCGKYYANEGDALIGDETALTAWKSEGGAGFISGAHTPGDWVDGGEIKASSCTEYGKHYENQLCAVCKQVIDTREADNTTLAEHNYVTVDGKADSCQDGVTGYLASYKCEVCNKHFSDNKGTLIGDGFDADFEAWKTGDGKDDSAVHTPGADATCTTTQTCTTCHGIIEKALGHKFENWTKGEEFDDGSYYKVYTCSNGCGTTEQRLVVNGTEVTHSGIEQVAYKAPTCTEEGHEAYWKCTAQDCPVVNCNGETVGTIVTIPATGHSLKDAAKVQYTWSDGYAVCTASGTCVNNNCGEIYTVTAEEIEETGRTSATCEAAGTITYKATFAADTGLDAYSETVAGDAKLGHDWNDASYVWSSSNTVCTATMTCKNDKNGEHTRTEVVEGISGVVTPATCEAEGYTTYSADFKQTWFADQTETANKTEATGHSWVAGETRWSLDGEKLSCAVDLVCQNDADHIQQNVAATEVKVTERIEAKCEQEGSVSYAATFDDLKDPVTTTVTIEALEHDWSVGYTWNDDKTSCTAKQTCSRGCVGAEETDNEIAVENTATCTEKGQIIYTAEFENDLFEKQTESKDQPALGHNVENGFAPQVDPTCQQTGTAEHYKCETCGRLFRSEEDAENNKPVDRLDLPMGKVDCSFVDYKYNEDASCTKAGTKTASCAFGCGKTSTIADEEHPQLDHVYTNYVYNDDASCLKVGTKTAECDTCDTGAKDTSACVEHPQLEHAYTKEEVKQPATCTSSGTSWFYCTNGCTGYEARTTSALGHAYELVKGQAATCYAEGWKDYYQCTRDNCGLYFANNGDITSIDLESWKTGDGKITKAEHQYESVVTAPTCLEKGYTTYTCKICPAETEGHSYKDNYKDALNHKYDDGVILHGDEPTCTEPGTKTFTCQNDCCTEQTKGHTYTEPVEALGHELVKIDGQASTCDAAGYNAYYQCAAVSRTGERSHCGYYFATETDTAVNATPIATTEEALTTWKTTLGENGGAIAKLEHKDENADHICDYTDCDDTLSECVDNNADHKCDFEGCKTVLSDCVDEFKDHLCDYTGCQKKLSDCADVDTDKDHLCDHCGKPFGDHKFTEGNCNCGYVQDLKVSITIQAAGQDDEELPAETIKYQNGGNDFTKILDLEVIYNASCYTILDLSAKVNGEKVESKKLDNTLTISSDLLTGDVEIIVQAHQDHQIGKQETVVVTPATCLEAGEQKIVTYCANCKTPYKENPEVIQPLDHNWKITKHPATFEADAYTEYECKNDSTHNYNEVDEGTMKIAVAQIIGGDKFETLEAAIAAATRYSAIEVLTKVTVEGTQTWDLNNITMILPAVEDSYGLIIKGDLTIKRGTFIVDGFYGIGVQSAGKLTIDGGTFALDEGVDNDYLIGSWGTTVINGGNFVGQYNCINAFEGTTTINGGTFNTAEYDSTGEYESWDVLGEDKGQAIITGGSFSKSAEDYLADGHCQKDVSGRYVVAGHIPGEAQEVDRKEPNCTNSGSYKLVTYCTRCEAVLSSEDKTIDALGHTVTTVDGLAATCTTDGYKEAYYCATCKKHYATKISDTKLDDEIEDELSVWQTEGAGKIGKLGHDLEKVNEVSATCEEPGMKEYWQCSVETCGVCFEDEAEQKPIEDLNVWKAEGGNGYIPATDHNYTSEVTTKPTCTEDGVRTYTCQNDKSHNYTEAEPKLNHNYVVEYQWNEDRTACTAVAVCANNEYHKAQMNAVVTVSVTTEAGCETEGAGVRTAAFAANDYGIVNQVEDVVIPATGHSFTKYVSNNDATCTENGTETAKCDNKCGTEDTRVVEDSAKGHSMDEIPEVLATCTNDGIIHHYFCSTCKGRFLDEQGKQSVETGKHIAPALKHEYTTEVTKPACEKQGYTTYTCIRGDHTYQADFKDALVHEWDNGVVTQAATCTEDGVMTYTCVRGCTKTAVEKATGHKGQWIAGQAGTCEVAGWNAYYQCQNSCGLFYADYNCTKPIGDAAALEAWKQADGKTGPYGHTYDNVPGKTPDCENAGWLASFVCSKSYCAQHFTENEAGEKVLIGDGSQAAYVAWIAEGGNGYIRPNGHTAGKAVISNVVAAKCEVNGSHVETIKCTVCQDTLSVNTVEDPATGHKNIVAREGKESTCTVAGYEAYWQCVDCNNLFSDADGKNVIPNRVALPLADHNEVDDEAVEATCTAPGKEAGKHCSVCGTVTVAQVEIPVKDHVLTEIIETNNASCEENGSQVVGCENCDYEITEVLEATGHTEEKIPAKDPDCITAGATEGVKCSACGEILTAPETIPANGHDYDWDGGNVVTDPTCTAKGYTTHICRVCDFEMKDSYTDMAPHTEVIDAAVPATCTATGLTEGKHCAVCPEVMVKQQITQMLPHTEVIDAAVPATCTETGLTEGKHCSVCNEVLVKQEVVKAKGHDGKLVGGQAAKCEQDGWKDYYQCNGCKLFFQDLECTQPIADVDAWKNAEDGGKIGQLGHAWDEGRVTTLPTCTEDGIKTFTCGNCNGTKTDAEPMLGHDTEKHDAQHPTYYSAGWEAYETCTRCDYSTFKAIEPLGEPSVGTFEEFMTSLKLLEEYANAYAKANPGKDPLWLLIKYVRTGVDRYNSGSWNIMAGYEDEGFAEYVMKQEETYNKAAPTVDDMINVTGIKNIKNFKIPNGNGVDFGHMFGTMDITYHNKNSINHADVAGWAGDLVDLLSTADRHDVTGTVDEMIKEIGETYLNHSIEGESDQFSQTDMYGDLDGYYFMNELIGTDYESGMLYSMMSEYFVSSLTTEQRADYFLKNRLGGVTGKNEIRDAVFSEYTGNSVIATLEGTREFKQSDVSDMRKACCYAFADYLCKLAGDYVEENENRHLSVFSSETSTLAPGITQQISKATTTDGKQVVYYTATADVTSPYVHVYANYKDNDPSLGWGMQRVRDQANAAQAKYGDPNSALYIPNYNVIAAVNGAGYNMTTGEPGGVLMMGGVEYHAPNGGGFFGIRKDGTACLGTDAEYYALKEKGELSEAIAIFGTTLIKDGKINVSSNDYSRASRTAIGYTKTGKVVTMVMDGRQEPVSCGGSMAEIAQVMLDAGCIYAVNLDGGGSTTYVARQEGEEELSLVSSPSDGFERSVSTSWLIVSTAPSSTAFDHAVLNSDVRHMTIGSTVQVTATGASATGSPAELPEGTTWTVSDAKVASVDQNGVVTALANGKFDVQLKLGDQIIGTRTLNVVVPDAVYFTKENMNAVYGEPATLPVAALFEGKPVAITEADVTFSLSNAAAGTTEGFTFTGTEASGIKNVKINAHAVNNPDATSGSININLFKAGDASFDFENADGGDRLLAWKRVVSNSTTVDSVTYTVVDRDKPMVTEYSFGMDMTQIPIPEELNDLIYMLPGADVEGNNSAWSFLLQLAERVSVLTEVKATMKLDPNFDVDYSKLSVICDYFVLENTSFDAETNELILSLRWKDQTKAIDPDTANPIVILSGIKLTPKADAAWNAKDQLAVVNSGNISYDIYLRANALYSFASKPENQETYKLYPFVNPDVIIGGAAESGGHFMDVYKEFNDEYTLNKGAKNGWVYEDGGYAYYEDGEKYIGVQKVGQFYYDFGTNGINVGQTKFTGMFQINGVNHYAKEGLLTGGWHIDGDDKYYFDQSGKAVDGEIVLDEVKLIFNNGLLIGGQTGFVKKMDGNTYYYQNGSMYYGWLEMDGKWYCFDETNGIMIVGDGTAASKLFPTQEAKAKGAYYVFNEEGHALYGFPNNYGYYYWADLPIRNEWVRNGYDLDGWYHTNDTGHFVTSGGSESYKLELDGVTYDAVKIAFDGVVYVFNDKNGKLLLGSMVLEDGFWYYYWAGEPVNDGWFEFDGETYYAHENGKLASGAQTIDGKSYMFTERGILIKEGTTLNVIMSNDLTQMTIKANNVKDAERVVIAIWSDANGQDDLNWIEATNDGNGVWSAVVDPLCQQHKDTGRYQIHAYEYHEDGTQGELLVGTIYDLAKIGHKTGEPVKQNVVAPTCTSAGGYDLVTICEACDEVIDTKHVVEPAVGNKHVYDDNVDGTCNVCGVDRATVEKRQVVHMLRMYNPYSGEHFYTGSEQEKNDLVAAGWHYEGVAFTFPANTGAPVHRLYDPVTGEHLYTMDEEEKATLMAEGWNYEGIAFNSAYDTEAVQHRLHNPYATVGAYHFTYSIEERDNLIAAGWEYQGIGWYSCYK